MSYALVHDDHTVRCHCISVRDTVEDLLEIPIEGKVRIIPIPDRIKNNGAAISQYCNKHKGETI